MKAGDDAPVPAAILMYHRVAGSASGISSLRLSTTEFKAHLECFRSAGYRVVPLVDIFSARASGSTPVVALTFDDGYADFLTEVAPLLAEFGMPATVFAVGEALTGLREFWWDTVFRTFATSERLPLRLRLTVRDEVIDMSAESPEDRREACQRVTAALYKVTRQERERVVQELTDWANLRPPNESDPRPMTSDEIRLVAGHPGMTVGAHTDHHLWLPAQPAPEQMAELANCRARLESLIEAPVNCLAYPYGATDQRIVEAAAQAGFKIAVTTEERLVDAADSALSLPRLDAGALSTADLAARLRVAFSSQRIPSRTLVAGWFSFDEGHATAGDIQARDLVCQWLVVAGERHDVALAGWCGGGVNWRDVDPSQYSQLVFVCGPFGRGQELEEALLRRFKGCRTIGINLSMVEPLKDWNPFDVLLERDSDVRARPDIVFAAPCVAVPVVGVCLVEPYEPAQTNVANAAFERLIASRDLAAVRIDTRLDANTTGLRTAAQVESLIARVDVLLTTRLHGLVFALKHGIPAVAIDPEPGGAKICRQARELGWPMAFAVDRVADHELQNALTYCLSEEARRAAAAAGKRASRSVEQIRNVFIAAVRHGRSESADWR